MTDFYTDLPDDGLGGPGKAFKYSKQLVIYLLKKKIISASLYLFCINLERNS